MTKHKRTYLFKMQGFYLVYWQSLYVYILTVFISNVEIYFGIVYLFGHWTWNTCPVCINSNQWSFGNYTYITFDPRHSTISQTPIFKLDRWIKSCRKLYIGPISFIASGYKASDGLSIFQTIPPVNLILFSTLNIFFQPSTFFSTLDMLPSTSHPRP